MFDETLIDLDPEMGIYDWGGIDENEPIRVTGSGQFLGVTLIVTGGTLLSQDTIPGVRGAVPAR